jgi:hypothetical protein
LSPNIGQAGYSLSNLDHRSAGHPAHAPLRQEIEILKTRLSGSTRPASFSDQEIDLAVICARKALSSAHTL